MKCPACPVTEGACVVETWGGERPHCGWIAAGRPGIADRVRRLSAGVQGDPTPPAPNLHHVRSRAVLACVHRSQPETCGCEGGMALCAAGKREFEGDDRVSFGYCLRCVAGEI